MCAISRTDSKRWASASINGAASEPPMLRRVCSSHT
jgi:hypothetical protein